MKIRRFICLFIALLFILSVAACANGANETEGSTSAQAQADTDPVAEVTTEREKYDKNGYLLDDIPDTLKLNTEIKLLYWSDVENVEFFVEEETGDAVSDAILTRNLRTEERLNVTFKYVGTPGNFKQNSAFVSEAINAKNNGDEFDLYAAYSMTTASLAHKGLCRDLNKLETINFSQPWWPSKLIDEAVIGNKLFFASGDLSTNMLYMMYTFFFNKDLLTQYNLESPYELVDSNGWTLSKMFEMSKVLDSAGSSGSSDKIYAFATSSDVHLDPFYFGAGLHILERDEAGNPVVSKDVRSALAQDVAEQVQDYLHLDYCSWTDTSNLFAAGQVLFTSNRARFASAYLSSVSFEYGVLPAPKYSSDQENFVTILGFPYTLYAVTDSSTQPDAAAAVLECLCSEGYRLITPALFELSMKIRYSTDNDASRMFQKIRDNVSFDLGRIFTSSLENYPYSTFRAAVKADTSNRIYSTKAKEAESKMNKLADSLFKALAKYDN